MYDAVAVCFIIFGVVVFLKFYMRIAEAGKGLMDEPFLVLLLFMPFIPASIFSWLARKKKKQLMDLATQPPEKNKK